MRIHQVKLSMREETRQNEFRVEVAVDGGLAERPVSVPTQSEIRASVKLDAVRNYTREN